MKVTDLVHSRLWIYGPPLAIALATCAVYANSLNNPFLFDDLFHIVTNPDIRHIWPLWIPHEESTWSSLNARVLVRLSLACNYALGELNPVGYHLFNLGCHVLCAITLYGVARRALLETHFAARAAGLALTVAMVWVLHPINSECINYISQRSEVQMGLFFLLSLYCALRSRAAALSMQWQWAAILCMALGTASKEVMVTAPIVLLFFEWTISTRSLSIGEILKTRWPLYLGALTATWGLFIAQALVRPHGAEIGGSAGIGPWDYLLNQAWIVTRYLRLCFWPHPLIFDYGYPLTLSFADVWVSFLFLAALLGTSLFALYQRRILGFLGTAFFFVLAPSSSIITIYTEVGAERRLYLPLVAVIALCVLAGYQLIQRFAPRKLAPVASLSICLTVAAALGWTTIERNRDYRSPEAIWSTVAAARPNNPRAYAGLARASEIEGKLGRAVALYNRALEMTPEFYEYIRLHRYIAELLIKKGTPARAADYYRRIIAERPADAEAQRELAYALGLAGDTVAALDHYELALRMGSDSLVLHYDLANLLFGSGDYKRATKHYQRAIELDPSYAPAFNNLGTTLAIQNHFSAAITQFEQALQLDPNYTQARTNLDAARATLKASKSERKGPL
ncbi:MAG: tetratricopeptide (TPR) repeat protein [Candidatus Latescibacterota bacterium]|jgi:tetratricopeptide (TPR) repeat protein